MLGTGGGETKDHSLLPREFTISLEKQSAKGVNDGGVGCRPKPGFWALP